jgi:hypothetical protein
MSEIVIPQEVLEHIKNHQTAAKEQAAKEKLQNEIKWNQAVDIVYAAFTEKMVSNDIKSYGTTTSFTIYVNSTESLYTKDKLLSHAINARLVIDYESKLALACSLTVDNINERFSDNMCCLFCCIQNKRLQNGKRYKINVKITMDYYNMQHFISGF